MTKINMFTLYISVLTVCSTSIILLARSSQLQNGSSSSQTVLEQIALNRLPI